MIVFHAWQQREMVIECGKKHGFNNAYPHNKRHPNGRKLIEIEVDDEG